MSHSNFEKNVFINCPFDKEYRPLLRPLIFSIVYIGYIPRITLENSDSGKPRLEQLFELIKESRYSIHDLSRLQSKGPDEYYRLNMPFELGLDYASRRFNFELNSKSFLILETKPYDYMKAISDINGLDIKNHNDSPEEVIECIRDWFIETVGLRNLDSHLKIWYEFMDFNTWVFEQKLLKYYYDYKMSIAEKMAQVEVDKMPIPELIDEMINFLSREK